MFKFNNDHIFTGYLKQLLASFHLPKCKVYTQDLEQQQLEYDINKDKWNAALKTLHETELQLKKDIQQLKELIDAGDTDLIDLYNEYLAEYNSIPARIKELQNHIPKILPTIYHSEYPIYPNTIPDDLHLPLNYPPKLRYVPYIKDGQLQIYTDGQWHNYHNSFGNDSTHAILHKKTKVPFSRIPYTYGQKILNYTKNLQIQNTVYDSYTHEYLGDYLRFHRDFANINLMPLYNCFSNRVCPQLDLEFQVGNNYSVQFKTDHSFETALYKYYMVPVKFFKDYTIAIDSNASIEVCCCIYDEYQNKDSDFAEVPRLTYQCFNNLQFKTPILYTKLQNLNDLLLNPKNNLNDLCQQEDNLKLILKIPVNNNSSIVILEGDYTQANDCTVQTKSHEAFLVTRNKTVINYEHSNACEFLADKLITPLQLLRANTGESYPFADRLIEYLVGNAITSNDEIKDNIVRAKTVISANCNPEICLITAEDGIWEPVLQCLTYDYINTNKNTYDVNHDVLGFIDKDVEKWYAHTTLKRDANGNFEVDPITNKPKIASVETIANIDIYKDHWRE
jgi:hypothetical protein